MKHGAFGERLEVIDWQGLEIVPVQKDFSFEHPAVAARSEEECERIRATNSIHVVTNLGAEDQMPKPIIRFEEAPFPDWAAAELRQMGFQQPTPIQVQAWPVVLKGHDFVGIAETGSGKTIAYVLPMLVHLMAQPELRPGEGPIGLILVPTRDLCMQVTKQVEQFVGNTGIVCRALYGGADINQQARSLAQRMDIAVATPGRLIALLNSSCTNLRRATFLVLDEADELLGQGFGEQVRLVLTQVRPDRQALMFSATWHKVVDELARQVCSLRPIRINVGSTKLSACKTIMQRFKRVEAGEEKVELLCKALDPIRSRMANDYRQRALVFCNHRDAVEPLVEDLSQRGYPCRGFHGQQAQAQRDEALTQFAAPDSGLWVLVCTQILGRGYDFSNVRYVINFDMPHKIVEYIHRIGRTGRAGQQGFSLSFFTDGDLCVCRDLAMVLRESGQEVPTWLAADAKRWKRGNYGYWARNGQHGHHGGHGGHGGNHPVGNHHNHHHPAGYPHAANHHAAAHAGSEAGQLMAKEPWRGRGRGDRRAFFLAELNGRGTARAAPPSIFLYPGG